MLDMSVRTPIRMVSSAMAPTDGAMNATAAQRVESSVLDMVDLALPFVGTGGDETGQQLEPEHRARIDRRHLLAPLAHRVVGENLGDGTAESGIAGRDLDLEIAARRHPAAELEPGGPTR